ncbi:hypothetical protein EVAR_4572_1 [Eumeta japonica]|uniref:Uncharacterized protein n=1 Tax=Eumeta variegata TaxID=151549 RepID=A0A4C1SW71_EUMVA|nr:hypothetical protein EVAR_4572_1 [Eumeta japonica]
MVPDNCGRSPGRRRAASEAFPKGSVSFAASALGCLSLIEPYAQFVKMAIVVLGPRSPSRWLSVDLDAADDHRHPCDGYARDRRLKVFLKARSEWFNAAEVKIPLISFLVFEIEHSTLLYGDDGLEN